jgi:phosphonate transport system ATP-binding protein
MIELLGVGASRTDGGWRLHRVCTSFRRDDVTLIVSNLPEERGALLDVVGARIMPEEGRVWISHVPVSPDTVRRIRGMVVEADLDLRPIQRRSLLWNVLVAGKSGYRALHGLLRLPRKSERLAARRALERVGLGGRWVTTAFGLAPLDRARLALASALVLSPEVLLLREIDRNFDGDELAMLQDLLKSLARRDRLAVLVSATTPAAATGFADRLVAIADGLLVFDGSPTDFSGQQVAWRFGTA